MSKSIRIKIARGITANWIALAFSMGVAFFLAPFVVHRLGNVAYGVWILLHSIISYVALLDLGLRGAITRFVSKYHTQKEHLESSYAVSAALWFRVLIGIGIMLVGLVFSGLIISLLRIPSEMELAARWVLIIMCINFAITLTFGIFGGVLAALHRFDILSTITIFQTCLRATGTVWLLKCGYGIMALAVWELSVTVITNVTLMIFSYRMYPELQISLRWPNPNVLRSLWGYGFYAFIINICIQIIYYTDNIIVGTFISAGAVTFYAIGGNLIEYLRQLVSSMTMTFTPLASTLEAQTQQDQLRRLLVHGTRAALIIALPIEVVLFFRGHTFIGLWMGEQYAQVSGRVLQILLLAQLFAIANFTSGGIAYGMAKHRPVALWAAGEAIFNLVLSVLLVRLVGLEGVAWGTVIPALAIHMLLWPRYICKLLEVPVWSYLWQGWIRPGLAVIPFSIACCFADHFWIPHSLVSFFLQIAVMLPLFFLGFGICFWQEAYSQLRTRTKWFTGNLLGAPEFPPGRVTNSKTPNY